jgi:flagellar hook-basal body complex protein FliE
MADPTINGSLMPLRQIQPPTTTTPATATQETPAREFKDYLLDSLEKVNQLQSEADAGVQNLLTGETDNVSEVLVATKKAGVAFDLLMEIRNKLMDAYKELQQMRV